MKWTPFVKAIDEKAQSRTTIDTVQVNIGKLCNQTCLHCHVEAGPHKKRENMSKPTIDRLLTLFDQSAPVKTIDITGGAPELNPWFRHLVRECRLRSMEVIDRCNLTVLFEPGQEDTIDFLAEQKVTVVASLPCYSRENVEKQRGDGVFDKSIRALRALNEKGYGSSELTLNLVYNPIGPHLPPPQDKLEQDYKTMLKEEFGIAFNSLHTITNMPIKRFLYDLKKQKAYDDYMTLLADHYNPAAAEKIMCRSLVSVSWDGRLYDCDFNQMLTMDLGHHPKSIFDIERWQDLIETPIAFADHCYGCTAGSGSSCGGSLTT